MFGPNLSAWALNHRQMVLFLILALSIAGALAFTGLGQKEDPEFTVKAMLVEARWPGASATQMAEQVIDELERELQEIEEIDYTKSYSRPGEGQITISLRDEIPGSQAEDIWYDVRRKLNDLKPRLPEGVQGPFFNEEFGDTYGNLYAVTGEDFSLAELKDYAETVRDEILLVEDVDEVQLVGVQNEVVFVEIDNQRAAALGIDPRVVTDTIAATNAVTPAGVVETADERIRLVVSGEFESVESLREISVPAAGGELYRLGDIAEVRRGLQDPPTFMMRHDGKPAIGLAVSMRSGGDVIELGQALDAVVETASAELPLGVEVASVSDQPKVVEESVNEFLKSLAEAVAIVLAVSFLSLGFRTGVVVALAIPLVLAMTFLAMSVFGIELQRISLGALIIALGLLVDDAIIAVETMARKLEEGWDKARAATYAYTATAFPMLTGTLITAAAFLPIGFAQSSAGEYTFSIFQVVGIALILSWIVAVIFTPYLGTKILSVHKGHAPDEDAIYAKPMYRVVRFCVRLCVRHARLTVGLTAIAFAVSLGLFAQVPKQFFPASSRPELIVDLWLPESASFAATETEVKAMEAQLEALPDVVSVTSYVGGGGPRFYLALDVQTPNIHLGQLMVMTAGEHQREHVVEAIHEMFANDFPNVRGRVNRLENGPPVGYPVQFRVSGPSQEAIESVAAQLEAVLRSHPNTRGVNADAGERLRVVRIEIDQDRARALGVTSAEAANALQSSLSGVGITELREGDDAIDVIGRLEEADRDDIAALGETQVYLGEGRAVPLSQIARIGLDSEPATLWRRDRLPTITVRADVAGAEGPDVSAQIDAQLDALRAELPPGVRIVTGGAAESSADAQASIFAGIPLAIGIILLLLMIQLQDMKKTALVLVTAPLGMIGVAGVLYAFQIPFGFVALLGVIALMGMIIRNSVILVAQVDHETARGVWLEDAIIESAVRRFRPIVLTALAAILAMIPLTHSTFWGPMAWAIMGGLSAATLLTMLVLPALYGLAFGARRRPNPMAELEAIAQAA